MRFTLRSITPADAREISRWRYGEPYSRYDGDPASVASLLEPRFLYHSVYDERGDLAGYFCFGEDARVGTGRRLGVYEKEPALDVGLGMSPELAGRGLGAEFVLAGLRFAKETYSPPAFRLSVASSNRRAVRVYEKVGFEVVDSFGATTPEGGREWLLMRREA
ncbi:MAG: GNAT family N-acetyltransferase [Actinomycetota bacterium]|nr:GNAT family N-acetyltransferase [Actinomycetota bacterium]